MKLSVITASRNRPDSLTRLALNLCSLPASQWGTAWEWCVSLADYATPPTLPEWSKVIEGVSGHSSRSVNRLLAAAQGEYVALLADDLRLYPATLALAVAYMDSHPEIAQGAFYVHTGRQACHVPMERGFPYAQYWIARRAVLREVGGYDETWKHYGVDYDLSCCLLAQGYGVAAIPGACLFDYRPIDDTMQAHQPTATQDGEAAAARWHAKETSLRDRWQHHFAPMSGQAQCGRETHA